jgi:DNA-binding HxlR family transcriptional regulator
MPPDPCCPHLHRAVELIGRRWTGAILAVLLEQHPSPLRFTELRGAVPDLSDRLLSERIRELEGHGIVAKDQGRYALTPMGHELAPALGELRTWAQRWLAPL